MISVRETLERAAANREREPKFPEPTSLDQVYDVQYQLQSSSRPLQAIAESSVRKTMFEARLSKFQGFWKPSCLWKGMYAFHCAKYLIDLLMDEPLWPVIHFSHCFATLISDVFHVSNRPSIRQPSLSLFALQLRPTLPLMQNHAYEQSIHHAVSGSVKAPNHCWP